LKSFVFICCIIFILTGCKKIDVFEKHASIPAFKWAKSYAPEFNFENADSTTPYLFYVVVRHANAYRYSNLWVRIGAKAAGDSLQTQDLELPLTLNNQRWAGTGMDDVYEVRVPVYLDKIRFTRKTGAYTFSIRQIMREDPLPHIMNIGLRIEKIPKP
jgi:gliding motility-associated lipoprotein GldH